MKNLKIQDYIILVGIFSLVVGVILSVSTIYSSEAVASNFQITFFGQQNRTMEIIRIKTGKTSYDHRILILKDSLTQEEYMIVFGTGICKM